MASTSERLHAALALVYPACMGCQLPEHLAATLEQDLCRGLGVRSQVRISTVLWHWMTWWQSWNGRIAAGTAPAIEAYIRQQEDVQASIGSITQRIWAIGRLLALLSWPDPAAEAVVRRVQLAIGRRAEWVNSQPPSAPPLGWRDIQRIVALTDQCSPKEVRTLAALLLLYETMARHDQIFGFKHQGRWIVPPTNRRQVSRRRDGGVIHLGPDSRGRGKRSVSLSEMTMAWLERSFALWPGEAGPLFRSRTGNPWSYWARACRKLLKQHGLTACSPTSLRWGKTRDLMDKGLPLLDVRAAAGWSANNSVLRVSPRSSVQNSRQHLVVYEGEPTPMPGSPRRSPRDLQTGDLFANLACS